MFENEHIKTFIEDGVLYMEYKQSGMLTLEVVKEAITERLKIANGTVLPIFVDFRKPHGATKEAKIYLSSDKGIEGLSACAVMINSVMGMVAFNFYMTFDAPPRPIKAFVHKEKALLWLNQFKTHKLN